MKALLVIALVAALAPRAHAKGCHEVSNVVGYEHCSRFGAWSREQAIFPFHMEVGWIHQDFTARPFTLSDEPVARSATDSNSYGTTADGVAVRWLGGTRLFYGGFEMDTSGLTNQPQFVGLPAAGASWSFLGVFGAHVSLWRFAVGAEIAAGARVTLYSYCSGGKSCGLEDTQDTGVLDARVRVEMFPAQRWSLGVMFGHSLLDRDAESLIVYTGFHMRALDGMY
jgi:hypothetical protein